MIGTTLQFARDDSASEPRKQVDLTALVQSVVDEMTDAGLPVRMQPAAPILYRCQPAALKRAVRNLLDNAVKYGKTGSAEIRMAARAVEIDIDDDGPGIPEAELVARAGAVLQARSNRAAARRAGSASGSPSRTPSCRPTAASYLSATGPPAACAPALCFRAMAAKPPRKWGTGRPIHASPWQLADLAERRPLGPLIA